MMAPTRWNYRERMDAVLKLRSLEKLAELRQDSDQFACCLLDPEYQSVF